MSAREEWTTHSAIFAGSVMHRRVRPRRHRLRYSIFSLLFDLDELDTLDARLRLFSRNKFNLFSFHDDDYGFEKGLPLKQQIEALLREAGVQPDGGAVRLLTIPRILGYAFNPLNVYFCYMRAGRLAAIVCEVNNTFGQRHAYVLLAEPASAGGAMRCACAKKFYVSPFIGMDLTYDFRITPPEDDVTIAIRGYNDDGTLITAVHTAARVEVSDLSIARTLLSHPLMAIKVIGGIHWEALKIWLKGVRLHERPAPPEKPATIAPRLEG
ncbi:MAG: DUF1365 domain-containing protein [Beijerinckiaceae bacterium]